MRLALPEWHHRFSRQSNWTGQVRRYLYQKTGLKDAVRVVEVGCGTGAITSDIESNSTARTIGLDIRQDFLKFAKEKYPGCLWLQADGYQMPFASSCFDIVFCHFLLLWVDNPENIIRAWKRVLRPGGWLAVLAEPDYGGRVDYPYVFSRIGALQSQALARQGADPEMGRKLNNLFHRVGLINIEVGVLGGQWNAPLDHEDWLSEWLMLHTDLHGLISPEELAELQAQDQAAWENGSRILYVPTFFGCGQVP